MAGTLRQMLTAHEALPSMASGDSQAQCPPARRLPKPEDVSFPSCRNESSQTQCCMTTHIDSLTVLGSGSCTGLVGRTQEGQGRAVPRLQGEPSPASRGAASLVTAPSPSSRPAAWPVHLSDPDPPASPL